MIISVNGERQEVPAGATIDWVVTAVRGAPGARGVAVAVAGEVVPRDRWSQTALDEGARMEIVSAVQGG